MKPNSLRIAQIDSLIRGLITEKKSAGAILGIQVTDNHPVIKTYGFADISMKKEVDKNHQFRIASITKPFTAVAILKLVEDKKLALEDTLDKFFPNFPNGNEITVYQLLSHTSGIPNWYEAKMPKETPPDFPMCFSRQKFISKMSPSSLFPPGTLYSYSNTGYVLLGEIIEMVSGITYENYLQEAIFEPSGMTDTEMEREGNESEQWVMGYGYDSTLENPFIQPEQYAMPFSAGGLRSTAIDLLRFIEALNDDKIITKGLRNSAMSYAKVKDGNDVDEDRFYFPEDFKRPDPPSWMQKYGYGLGFEVMQIHNTEVVSHGGSIAGFRTLLMYIPESSATMILMTNTGNPGGYSDITVDLQRLVTELE
ncbi:serine hydrolase domain-containing protein [Maribacter sp. 2210JD10-5]|uniref:serine hydrolase domain-containing protein n=1 Tax=Maribacter sp. 2210JD10-5 TaxID=3386272 RepID=UPI0039BCFCA3